MSHETVEENVLCEILPVVGTGNNMYLLERVRLSVDVFGVAPQQPGIGFVFDASGVVLVVAANHPGSVVAVLRSASYGTVLVAVVVRRTVDQTLAGRRRRGTASVLAAERPSGPAAVRGALLVTVAGARVLVVAGARVLVVTGARVMVAARVHHAAGRRQRRRWPRGTAVVHTVTVLLLLHVRPVMVHD